MVHFKSSNYLKLAYATAIKPKSLDKEIARREYILNILLVGVVTLSLTAFVINALRPILYPSSQGETPLITGGIFIILMTIWGISRKGYNFISASILVGIFLIIGFYGIYQWGPELGTVLLLLTLVVIMSSILIGTKASIISTGLILFGVILSTHLELNSVHSPNLSWKNEPIRMTDSIVNGIFFMLIASISWLFNREVSIALKRAQDSENKLKKERDLLEIKVEERTHELRQAQAEKMVQLYKFAEIGRSASGVFHDLAGPLNLISLNLEKLNIQKNKVKSPTLTSAQVALERAIIGTKRIESFIHSAKKQIQDQKVVTHFSAGEEIKQAVQIMQHRARAKNISITFLESDNLKIWGNPIKFYQVIINLISNAIDAYETKQMKSKTIEITLIRNGIWGLLTVKDLGSGIEEDLISKIFEPLFTTKASDKGIGLGLSITKEIVEKDFNGDIKVESTKGEGTTFLINLDLSKKSQ